MTVISRRKLASYTADRLSGGEATSKVLRELAAFLIDTRRTKERELIIRDVEAALLERGTALATVVSARPLDQEATRHIEQLVKQQYPSVTSVLLRAEIDASVIGGFKLSLADKQLDATIRTKLDTVRIK